MSKYSRKKVERILMVGRGMSLRIAGLYFCNSQRNNRCYQLVGAVSSEAGMRREFDIPMLGSIDRMEEVFQENPFERVLIVDKRLTAAEREKVVGFCQKNGLECADFMLSAPGISGDANVHGVICPKYLLEFCDMLFLLALSVVCSYFMFGGLDLWGVAIMVAVPITSLICSKLYRVNWGSVGIGDRWRLLQSSSFGAFAAQILCGLMVVVLRNCDLTLEYAVGALIYILAFCGGLQMFRLLLHPSVFFKLFSRKKAGERILIMGGGLHCRLYLLRLMVDPGEYRPVPVGIIDDDLLLHGMSCHGLRVLGGTKDLADIRQRFRFDRIVVTPASVPGATLEELYRFCAENNIKCSSFSVCERPAGMKN